MSITICFVTARDCENGLTWFLNSLERQMHQGECLDIIIVNLHSKFKVPTCWTVQATAEKQRAFHIVETRPKPNVWQGEYRLTKDEWWALSNNRNTGLCLCTTDYIVWLDDRSVLMPGWLDGIKRAAKEQYAVSGTYEKRHNMVVEDGEIKDMGQFSGKDSRDHEGVIRPANTQFWGGTLGCPVEWALAVNGFDERCDSLSGEDYIFGMMLQNSNMAVMFDPTVKIIQDRTPGQLGKAFLRTSKQRWHHDTEDKGHEALRRFGVLTRAQHDVDIPQLRDDMLNGGTWPLPPKEYFDWFDGQSAAEM